MTKTDQEKKTYQVAIADTNVAALRHLHDSLTRLGHIVVASDTALSGLLAASQLSNFEVVICDITSSVDYSSWAEMVSRFRAPVIITANDSEAELLHIDLARPVFGVLQKPLRELELASMIMVAVQLYSEFVHLSEEADSLKTALEDRKIIEQAKGVLMQKCGLDEAGAFRHLQHLARQNRQKTVDIAKGILIAESAFAPVVRQANGFIASLADNLPTEIK